MSKFAKAITATLTGDVKAARDLKLNYTQMEKSVTDVPVDRAYGVRFKAEFSCTRYVRDDLANHNVDQHSQVMHDIKRAMIEEVFGEFRPLLIELRSASYDEDQIRVRELLAQLEHQMFHEGV